MLPDREACLDLLARAGCSDEVKAHVKTVARLALALASHTQDIDPAVIEAGGLLHDVGRGFDHGPSHVPEGVAFLQDHDIDEQVVSCVACHMGAGVEPAQARAWGWPADRRYTPETLPERIVAHADNLTFGTTYKQLADVEAKLRGKGLETLVPRMRALHRELTEELGIDPDVVARELARSTDPGVRDGA